ncbi:hypothetical protein PENTCL1PPCAC_6219, partial [Pristionchus entomophagus]
LLFHLFSSSFLTSEQAVISTEMSAGCAEIVRSILRPYTENWTETDVDYAEMFLDFVHASPTESERQLYDMSEQIIARGNEVLDDLALYGDGPREAAVQALREGSDSEKVDCAHTMEPYIRRIKEAYSVSKNIQQVLPKLLWELCSGPLPPLEQLESRQALLRQFTTLVVFAMRFDEMKVRNPSMINHFSIYRRLTSTINALSHSQDIKMDNDVTWFLATANSMTDVLYKTTESFIYESAMLPKENTIDTLYTIVRLSCAILSSPSSSPLSMDTRLFVQRVLVGCVLLFDSVHPQGSFSRESIIDMRSIINVLSKDENHKKQLLHPLLIQVNQTKKAPVSPKVRQMLQSV